MGKNSAGEKREAKLKERLEEMQKEIDDLTPQYDRVKQEYQEAVSELERIRAERDKYIKECRDSVKDEVMNELHEKIDEVDKKLTEAEAAKTEAVNIKTKAEQDSTNILNKAKTEADKYYNEKHDEADTYYDNKHDEADTYYTEKTTEANITYTDANKLMNEAKTQAQKNDEKEIKNNAKENELSIKENELKLKEDDAIHGFGKVLSEERKKYDDDISNLKNDIAELEKELITRREEIDAELAKYKGECIKQIDNDMKATKKSITTKEETLDSQIADNTEQKAILATEKQTLAITKQTYETKLKKLDSDVKEKVEELYAEKLEEITTYKQLSNNLQKELSDAKKDIIDLKTKLKNANGEDLEEKKAEIKRLKEKVEELQNDESSVIKRLDEYHISVGDLHDALNKINQHDALIEKINQLSKEKYDLEVKAAQNITNEEALEIMTKRANTFEADRDNMRDELERMKKPTRKERLSSLTNYSAFDPLALLPAYGNGVTELDWLKNIKQQMDIADYKFSDKLLYAFHTSVKIHDWSPLVVLAGVSGTGKSELPRQYAHHGGMNFIAVPVKPDWDSMQSLFGYYNSIENKFEPTELCRAIHYMKADAMKNTMLLVLLDEMNLAYVELYFSDLLSKFETNRGTNDVITYDISLGANEAPEQMEIGDNVLWVGTMNEDETTKALSDKVVDRSTLITFPRPKTLVSRKFDTKIAPTTKRLPNSLWKKWCEDSITEEQLRNSHKIDIDKYRHIVEEINEKMSTVNRNLGHRVWQSIERYVFSHPLTVDKFANGSTDDFVKQFDSAFAEAVAFKIMPKLRGIEVSGESKKTLEEIKTIIDQYIPALSEDYTQAMSLSTRIFQWCSAKFMDVDEKETR